MKQLIAAVSALNVDNDALISIDADNHSPLCALKGIQVRFAPEAVLREIDCQKADAIALSVGHGEGSQLTFGKLKAFSDSNALVCIKVRSLVQDCLVESIAPRKVGGQVFLDAKCHELRGEPTLLFKELPMNPFNRFSPAWFEAQLHDNPSLQRALDLVNIELDYSPNVNPSIWDTNYYVIEKRCLTRDDLERNFPSLLDSQTWGTLFRHIVKRINGQTCTIDKCVVPWATLVQGFGSPDLRIELIRNSAQ